MPAPGAGCAGIGRKGVKARATEDEATAQGIPGAGKSRDNRAMYGDDWLTGTQYHWDVYQIQRLQQGLDGTWVAGNYYGNIADGFVGLSTYGDLVSEETRATIEAKKAELAANPGGEFTGPIVDTSGKAQPAACKQPTYAELMSMSYLAEGVHRELPAG